VEVLNPDWTLQQSEMADTDFQLFQRFSATLIATAISDTAVVMLIGHRQWGKTTLVLQFADKEREYVTLDDDTELDAALSDPALCANSIWSHRRSAEGSGTSAGYQTIRRVIEEALTRYRWRPGCKCGDGGRVS